MHSLSFILFIEFISKTNVFYVNNQHVPVNMLAMLFLDYTNVLVCVNCVNKIPTPSDLFIQSVSKNDLLLRWGGGVVGLGMLSRSEFTAGPIVLVWIAESEFVLKEHNMKHGLTYCFPWSERCRGWKKAADWGHWLFPSH